MCRFSDHSLLFCMAGGAQSWCKVESLFSSGTKMLLRFPEAITHWINNSFPGLNSDQEVNS